jgi:hypothetical protein
LSTTTLRDGDHRPIRPAIDDGRDGATMRGCDDAMMRFPTLPARFLARRSSFVSIDASDDVGNGRHLVVSMRRERLAR